MNKKNFNLFLGIGIILVLSLYFVFANSIATKVTFNENASANYDEGGILFVNWTQDGSASSNYTIYLWMNNNYVNRTLYVNNSLTGYTWGANATEANYTFTVGAVTALNGTETNATNVSMYVDTTAPLVNWTNSGYTNLTKKSNTTTLTLNISVGDASSGVASGNSYCVFDINGTNETVAVSSGWCNSTQLNLTNLVDGNYSIDIWANDTVGNVGVNLSTYFVWMDTTVPAVSSPTRPVVNGNYSGSIVLNVSIVDAGGAVLVWFNITNSSEMTNGSYTATNPATNPAGYWNATLNTSLFPDGTYNVTVYANDTANNLNSSISSGAFTIDNTNPVAAFTCSPTSVNSGAIVTCTCTGTDTGVGVNSSLTTVAVAITTNATLGTFTTTDNCTITDYAGNTHNTTTTYTVTSDAANVGGSSTTTAAVVKWTKTYPANENQFKEGYTKQVEVKGRVKFKVENIDHHMGVLELTDTTAKIEVASTPQNATLAIGDIRKFDVSEDGYYDLIVTLNSISGSKADITIKAINELVTGEAEAGEQEKEGTAEKEAEGGEEIQGSSSIFKTWWFWLIIILIIVGVGYSFQKKK